MNPFTRFLLSRKSKKAGTLVAFVERWDVLEALVIRVFKSKRAETVDLTAYSRLRDWLSIHYTQWERELRPYWQQTKAAGQITKQDPFLRLLAAEQAGDFVGDWEAMQYLPAAREALNLYIQATEGHGNET